MLVSLRRRDLADGDRPEHANRNSFPSEIRWHCTQLDLGIEVCLELLMWSGQPAAIVHETISEPVRGQPRRSVTEKGRGFESRRFRQDLRGLAFPN